MEPSPTKLERYSRESLELELCKANVGVVSASGEDSSLISNLLSILGIFLQYNYFVHRFSPKDSCEGCQDTSDLVTTLNVPAISAYYQV